MESETSNKILEVKIDGFSKLTDERFLNIKETLLRIENNSQAFSSKNDLEEVKKDFTKIVEGIKGDFAKHNEDDEKNFGKLIESQKETSDIVKTWIGGLAVIVVILPIAVALFFHYFLHF